MQDEQIQSGQDFILQGKNAVDFLKTASNRTDEILIVAKMIKEAEENSKLDKAKKSFILLTYEIDNLIHLNSL